MTRRTVFAITMCLLLVPTSAVANEASDDTRCVTIAGQVTVCRDV